MEVPANGDEFDFTTVVCFLTSHHEEIASFATALGLILTAIALFVTACEIRRTRKAADFDSIGSFFDRITDRETALIRANDASRVDKFNDLFNSLEIHALAVNRRLVGKASRALIRHKLIGVLAIFDENKEVTELFDKAIDNPETFSHLQTFRRRHRKEIAKQRELVRRNAAVGAGIVPSVASEEVKAP